MEKRKISFVDMNKIHERRKQGFGQNTAAADSALVLALDGLEQISEDMERNHTPKISEALFKNRFLFAFAGLGTPEENYAIYLSWITDIAKNYNISVQVCSDTTEEVLFTVPGIGNSATINPEKSNTREIMRSISMANDARFLQPMNWEIILQNNLDGILLKLYDKTKINQPKDFEVWLNIFKRYEKELKEKREELGIKQEPIVKEEEKQNNTSTEYIEVDDPI